jgi:demethylmenaquinone methyltransferase / 2-methoxy-6-polyprenyl-1,4-benzoquinol methylase
LAYLNGRERADYVKGLFTNIAAHYDLMNRIMTAGQDMRWRREVIQRASLSSANHLLDLGTGTGDLARLAKIKYPAMQVTAADFTVEMMRIGKKRNNPDLGWLAADAIQLPFEKNTFDAVISGFLLRNLADIYSSLKDQYRVLKPGGKIVTLDTTPPSENILKPLINFHFYTIIPNLGRLLTQKQEAYHYLPDSTERFLQPDQLIDLFRSAGFTRLGYRRLMFGTIAIHWGEKPGYDNNK